MPAMLKRQQFEDGRSEKIVVKRSKCKYLNKHNHEKKNTLDKDERKIEGIKYILFFLFLFFFFKKC